MSPTARVKTTVNRSETTVKRVTRSQSSRTLSTAINNVIATASISSAAIPTRRVVPRSGADVLTNVVRHNISARIPRSSNVIAPAVPTTASTSSAATPTRKVVPRSGADELTDFVRCNIQTTVPRPSNVTAPAVPATEIADEWRGNGGEVLYAPRTPENGRNNDQVVVDLITPVVVQVQPQIAQIPVLRARRPLEVDLTCDLDDEVFVVLEDIVNPSRRTNLSDLPIMLGSSPPRTRVLGPRNLRSTYGSRPDSSENPVAIPSPVESASQQGGSQTQEVLFSCPICLDSLSQVKEANQQMHSTICGHLFCGPCIKRVINTTQQCPTCRQKLDMRKIHPIFI